MGSGDTASEKTLSGKSTSATRLETTTRSVKRLIARQSVLAHQPQDSESPTDTLSVMLRLGPGPAVLLMMDDESARARIARQLAELSVDFAQSAASHEALEVPVGVPAILLTDDLELIRSVREDRAEPRIHCLFLAPEAQANLAEAMLAGADDCIGRNAGRDALRARFIAVYRNTHLEASFRALLRENRKLSTTDELTKVANRRFFARHFPLEVDRAARYGNPLSLIMCDIDHFKKVNDTWGHLAGDEVLREFGSRLQQTLRQGTDWVARVGGEEFAIVLPETGPTPAMQVADKLRERVQATRFRIKAKKLVVTASFGVCSMDPVPAREDNLPERIQAAADAALYESKDAGRDRVTGMSLEDAELREG